jgi:hypothetical protein
MLQPALAFDGRGWGRERRARISPVFAIMKMGRYAVAGLATAATLAWPHGSPAADSVAWGKLVGGLLNDAPVQVPSAVLLLAFAVLTLGSLLLIRAVAMLGRSETPPRWTRWFARSDESRAT